MAPGSNDKPLPGASAHPSHDGTGPGPAAKARPGPFAGLRSAIARMTRHAPALLLADCLAAYLDDLALRARPRTVQAARLAAARFLESFGPVEASALSAAHVMAWRSERSAAGAANKTINTELGYIQSALALAVRNGQLGCSPLARIRALPIGARHRRRQPRALSMHELVRLLDAAEDMDGELGGFPREPLIRTLAQTGMRWGEAVALTWADFDDEALVLLVKAEDSKTGVGRALPIDADLAERITGLRRLAAKIFGTFPEPGTPIFRTPRGSAWGPNSSNFRRHFSEVLARAGIARKDGSGRVVCVHALRHTFATRLARAGVSLAQAQALTGHRSPTILLQVYTHLQAEEARAAVELLRLPGELGRESIEEAAPASRRPASDRDSGALWKRGGSPGRYRTYNPAVNSRRVGESPPDEPPEPKPAA